MKLFRSQHHNKKRYGYKCNDYRSYARYCCEKLTRDSSALSSSSSSVVASYLPSRKRFASGFPVVFFAYVALVVQSHLLLHGTTVPAAATSLVATLRRRLATTANANAGLNVTKHNDIDSIENAAEGLRSYGNESHQRQQGDRVVPGLDDGPCVNDAGEEEDEDEDDTNDDDDDDCSESDDDCSAPTTNAAVEFDREAVDRWYVHSDIGDVMSGSMVLVV